MVQGLRVFHPASAGLVKTAEFEQVERPGYSSFVERLRCPRAFYAEGVTQAATRCGDHAFGVRCQILKGAHYHEKVPDTFFPDTLLSEIPLSGNDTLLATVSAPGLGKETLPPACLPYSPEYLPRAPGRGSQALQQIAQSTGGTARLKLADIWDAIPRQPRLISFNSYPLLAAIGIFLLEIIQRRTGLLTTRWLRTSIWPPIQAARRWFASTLQRRPRGVKPGSKSDTDETQPPAPKERETDTQSESPATAPEDSMLDALRRARKRVQNRTGRT